MVLAIEYERHSEKPHHIWCSMPAQHFVEKSFESMYSICMGLFSHRTWLFFLLENFNAHTFIWESTKSNVATQQTGIFRWVLFFKDTMSNFSLFKWIYLWGVNTLAWVKSWIHNSIMKGEVIRKALLTLTKLSLNNLINVSYLFLEQNYLSLTQKCKYNKSLFASLFFFFKVYYYI